MVREGCVCCPYPLLTIPALLSFIALVFVWVAAINCNFFSISFSTVDGDGFLRIGLWTVQSWYVGYAGDYTWGSYCAGWKDANLLSYYDLDGAMKTARAFSMFSAVLGTISFILILIPMCVSFGERQHYLLILCSMCVVTGLTTFLDLVALASDLCNNATSCELQGSGILSIVGGILWLVIAGLMFLALKSPRSFRHDNEDDFVMAPGSQPPATATAVATPVEQPTEQKEVRTIQNADGSATTTTTVTVTNPDGSKTVTQTTEVIPPVVP